ncbi:MAG TPA: prolyl oligopeptidase family serine peptidase [Dokdonella sp.]|uniref:prolyl oligopeptidase family serine peptidase n=1 Tax=Dokdonella sp. TaxID=2291710 RepID=UPI0025BB5C8E|nr:prolyl oligopeptidase family serine peptidase [Dokdonella sp.]MBX3693489.1 S9 family peptidase [Dokdonella sp.]MCW5567648.1 S9 family peptidase [Dokdonella sp.]HNR92682.1 prolyl oligopeptidase family serine peptidase [Dokdonella sp.]
MFRIPNLLPALAGVAIGVLAGCKPAAIAPDSAKAAPAVTTTISYPAARRVDQVDDYHGTRIADPYRWLEELDSDETRAWIEAQNALTQRHLDAIPQRAALRQRLEQLWNYERYTPYERHGDLYAYMRNDGLQNQAVLYVTDKPGGGEARVLLDPNTLSSDGTVAFKGGEFSRDGKLFAYGLSSGGSDWEQWRVLDVASGKPLDDMLDWVKFSDVEWAADGSGFYYSRYDKPEGEHALKAVNQFQKLYFHRVGTSQADDRLVYERKDEPDWGFGAKVTDDGRHLLISVWRSTEPKNLLLHRDLRSKNATVRELIGGWTASYAVLGSKEGTLYVLTDDNAPRYRIVAIDIAKPTRQHWREVVPEAAETLTDAKLVGGQLVANYLKDAHSEVRRIALDGTPLGTVELPGLGTATGFTGKVGDQESYFGYTSYTDVPSIYRLDLASGRSERVIAPDYPLDTSVFTTRQVFYTSRDGTRVPMFINSRKGLRLDGNNPTILYGYGGFNISRTPAFSPAVIAWLERGGVYVEANLRGGGEYGRAWHEAGTKLNKQNVFDDFIAAAEHLIAEKVTSPKKLAIRGGSNGGLLVGAVELQRPDLFAAAIPAVGVLDMLRFREFTIGKAWESDFGSVRNADEFAAILKYSPLHNIKPGIDYPATLVTTGDHDDRVFPAHSFKYAAALQAMNPPRPALIRIDVRAGHGQGKPTSKQIDEAADVYAFILDAFGIRD